MLSNTARTTHIYTLGSQDSLSSYNTKKLKRLFLEKWQRSFALDPINAAATKKSTHVNDPFDLFVWNKGDSIRYGKKLKG